jgi:hypothetical protein
MLFLRRKGKEVGEGSEERLLLKENGRKFN